MATRQHTPSGQGLAPCPCGMAPAIVAGQCATCNAIALAIAPIHGSMPNAVASPAAQYNGTVCAACRGVYPYAATGQCACPKLN